MPPELPCRHERLAWPERPVPARTRNAYYWHCTCKTCGVAVFKPCRTDTLKARFPEIHDRMQANRKGLAAERKAESAKRAAERKADRARRRKVEPKAESALRRWLREDRRLDRSEGVVG